MKKNNISKRDQILGENKKGKIYILTASFAVLLTASVYFFLTRHVAQDDTKPEPVNISASGTGITQQVNEVRYPISNFSDGKAKFFSHNYNGVKIKYFLLKSSDGVIRSAFDACDVCWEAGKGYTQKGDSMICNNCGRSFISTNINVLSGGCNPAPLKIRTSGNEITVSFSDIAEGEKYFKGVR